MSSILGKVSFNASRTGIFNPTNPGIADVPIVLQDVASGLRLVVLTDANGNFEFTNVADGSYRLVESYGTTGGVPSPGNFSTASVGSVPDGIDPPISYVPTAPVGATNLDSLSPNTRLVTVAGADIANLNFLDGPVKYESLIDPCATIVGPNLITAGDNGIFGTYPAGTGINYAPAVNPYPGITEGTMIYVNTITAGGQFTLRNIFTDGNVDFWKLANKTTGDETGGMIAADPAGTGSEIVFSQDVTVLANTSYVFSFWIANLMKVLGYLDPYISVRVLDSAGGVILDKYLSAPIPPNTSYPEWLQLGTSLDTGNNTQITIQIMSTTTSTIGNDFVIDDVQLVIVEVPEFIPVKSASKSVVLPGDVFTYSVTLANTCQSALTNVYFQDSIPSGTTFVDGSVKINNTAYSLLNPQTGFGVDDIAGESTTTITFNVQVLNSFASIPSFNGVIENQASLSYEYTPIQGGSPTAYDYTTNEVNVSINSLEYLIQQYLDFINNGIFGLDCDNLLEGINQLIAQFNALLQLTKEYILYLLATDTSLTNAFKSQLERFVDAISSYISMTTSLEFTNSCNNDVFAYLLSLMLELSLLFVKNLELLNGIISIYGTCDCLGYLDSEILIGKFINSVTMLFALSEDWRQILTWVYQNTNSLPSYVAAYVPSRPPVLPPPRPVRSACVPCPPQPLYPQQCNNRYPRCGC